MAWSIRLSSNAAGQLGRLPRDQQEMIARAIDRMEADPFQGDVQPLKGRKWRGRYRKRVGRFHLILVPFPQERRVEVSAVLLRSEQTYR
jgi:mRNA-degrading endonuclease RelE of RelBE toxin-antitoxin system